MVAQILDPVLNIFRFHKRKVFLFFGLYIICVYFFFPYNDLGDFVAAKVSEGTQGQVFVDFDNLDLGVFPHPGLQMSKVTVETPYTPQLSAKLISVSPSIAGFLAFKPGVNVHAEDLLGGDLDLSAGVGDKTANPPVHRKQRVSLELSQINLANISKIANLPLRFDGDLSGSLDSQIDGDFTEQPTAELNLQMAKTVLPEGNISTPFGPIGLPRINLGDVTIEGRADKGQIEISKFVAGKPGGDLYATIVGKVDFKMLKTGSAVQPQVGAYDLTVKIQVGESLKQKLGSFLGILQSYQTAANTYAFRVSAPNTFAPPNLTKSAGP